MKANITFVSGDARQSLEVEAEDQLRLEPYGLVWRPAGDTPTHDVIFPWNRIEEVDMDVPEPAVPMVRVLQ